MSIMNAFLLQLASFSFTRKSWISSGASGIKCSKFLNKKKKKKSMRQEKYSEIHTALQNTFINTLMLIFIGANRAEKKMKRKLCNKYPCVTV